jgi:hypothetical protein
VNKKFYLLVSVIILILVALFIVGPIKYFLIEKYYPTKGCDLIGSSIGAINKECECSGLKLSFVTKGLTKSICVGKRSNFQCWNRNNIDRNKQIVECD